MMLEGFFVTPETRARQAYRTDPLYRRTFPLLLAIVATVILTGVGKVVGHVYESGQADQRRELAGREDGIAKEQTALQPVVNRIAALAALRKRIEKRTPAARILAALEAAAKQCPNICLREVNLESASDEKSPTDLDRWNIKVQAVTRVPDLQTVSDFRDALNRGLSGGAVNLSEQPNLAQAEPQFSLQGQYPR
ncbi:MAG TPA: hypothetical protein VGD78_22425 [Chthoniobacterales bacterium]